MKVKLLRKVRNRFKITYYQPGHPDIKTNKGKKFGEFVLTDSELKTSFMGYAFENEYFPISNIRGYEETYDVALKELWKNILYLYIEYGTRRARIEELKKEKLSRVVWP